MIQLTSKNLKKHKPEAIADALSGPGAETAIQVTEIAMPFLSELFTYLTGLIGQRKVLKKRVETLEALAKTQADIIQAQAALNEKQEARLAALEAK